MVANEKLSSESNGDARVNSEPIESVSLLKKTKSRYIGIKSTEPIVVSKNQLLRTRKERSGISPVEMKAKVSTSNSNCNEEDDDFALIKEKVIDAARNQQLVSAANQSSSQESMSSSDQLSTCLSAQPTKQVANNKKAQKPRRRVATLAQRRAANIRERRRMFNLNAAFDRLRKKVPSFAYEKRLSRIETLKLAIMYIRFMDDLVNDDAYAEKYKQLTANTSGLSAATGFLSSSSYLSLYGHCKSPSPIPANQGHNNLKQTITDELHTNQASQISNFTSEYNATTKLRRDETRKSLIKMENITHNTQHNSNNNSKRSNQAVQINSTAFSCNENHQCLLNQSCLAAQYRVPTNQQQVGSPGNSAGICCSSPTSSSVTTCYSSSTFNESPNSSPLLHLQATAPPPPPHPQHHNQPPQSSQEQQVSSTSSGMYYAANQQTAAQQPHYQNQNGMHESIEHQRGPNQTGITSTALSSLANSVYHQSSSENLSNGISKPSSAFFYYNGRADMAELQANKSGSSEFVNYSSAQAQTNLNGHRSHFHQSQQQQNHAAQVAEQVAAPLMAYSSHSLQAR